MRSSAPPSNRARWTAVVLLAVAVLSSCGDDTDVAGGPGTDEPSPSALPLGVDLVSTDVVRDGVADGLVPGTLVRLTFHEDGRVIAAAGCNTISIEVEEPAIVDGTFRATAGATTEMGCDPARHQQDEWLADLLSSGPSWSWDGATLVLASGDDELTLVDREVAEPDLPLEGTRWVLDTIIEGDGPDDAVSSVSEEVVARVRIGLGGLTGSDGCNEIDAEVELDGESIEIVSWTTTDIACEDADVERVVEAFDAVFQEGARIAWSVESDRLTLTGDDGQGLAFTAEEP